MKYGNQALIVLCAVMVCLAAMTRQKARAVELVPAFTGSGSYVYLGTPGALQIPSGNPLTVEGWMFLNALSTRDMLYCKSTARTGSPYTYMFGFINSTDMAAYTGGGGSPTINIWQSVPVPGGVETGRWYHLAFSFDGTNMSFYLDGAVVGATAYGFSNIEANDVKIGGFIDAADINGSMSDVRVWDHARSHADIQSVMTNRLSGAEVGLLSYWPLNEGSGTDIFDATTNASDGTLIGVSWTTNENLTLVTTGGFVFTWPFALSDIETGSEDFTNTNEVDVVAFPAPDGCDLYQVTESGESSAIDEGGWVSIAAPPATISFSLPAADTNITRYAWFTNSLEAVTLRLAYTTIRYATAAPVAAARATCLRVLTPGNPVTITPEEIDDGSAGGTTDGEAMPIHSMSLNLLSGPDTNATPDEPYITVGTVGDYEIELVVMNEAGNVATSSVCALTITAYAGEDFIWTGADDSDWFNHQNWEPKAVPIDGANVLISGGASVSLTNSTASLNSFIITNSMLVFSNWDATLMAAEVIITGTGLVTHVTNSATSADGEGEWVPDARVSIACTNLTIAPSAAIDVDYRGYKGGASGSGYGPGLGGSDGTYGGGGGYGGQGGARSSGHRGAPYGSLENPTGPGSGGGKAVGGGAGGAGGGAVYIAASNSVVIDGKISACGKDAAGGGSGGSIYIKSRFVGGTGGSLAVRGGDGGQNGGGGGGGRLAVHVDDAAQSNAAPVDIILDAGSCLTWYSNSSGARPGTIYLSSRWLLARFDLVIKGGDLVVPGVSNLSLGNMTITNGMLVLTNSAWNVSVATNFVINTGGLEFSNCVVTVGGDLSVITCWQNVSMWSSDSVKTSLWVGGDATFSRLPGGLSTFARWFGASTNASELWIGGALTITTGGVFYVYSGITNDTFTNCGAQVTIDGELSISNGWLWLCSDGTNGGSPRVNVSNVSISGGTNGGVTSRGYLGGGGGGSLGRGPGYGRVSSWYASGAGYGGMGGAGANGCASTISTIIAGTNYGSYMYPLQPGSSGGSGPSGGGLVWLEIDKTAIINGTLAADGGNASGNCGGGGSGGGVFLRCRTLLGSNAVLSANGGKGMVGSYCGGGGGGGRIAVWCMYQRADTNEWVIQVDGGTGGFSNADWDDGAEGTIYFGTLPHGGAIFSFH